MNVLQTPQGVVSLASVVCIRGFQTYSRKNLSNSILDGLGMHAHTPIWATGAGEDARAPKATDAGGDVRALV